MEIKMYLILLLTVLSWEHQTVSGQESGVTLMLNGEILFNNSYILITEIGEDSGALLCVTNFTQCCHSDNHPRGERYGQWYFPDNTTVGIDANGRDIYRNRGLSVVRLNRRNKVFYPTGLYRCVVPDSNGVNQILYANIYGKLQITFLLRDIQLPNNSVIPITDVGEGVHNSLLCITDNETCCKSDINNPNGITLGDWYFPNGTAVKSLKDSGDFYRNRGSSVVRLNRKNNVELPTGLYYCEIPDADGVNQSLYVNLDHIRVLSVSISSNTQNPIGPNDTATLTLTCIFELDPSVRILPYTSISVTWHGPLYGAKRFLNTDPVRVSTNTSHRYIDTVSLSSSETYYDSGIYNCSAQNFVGSIEVLFQYPHRPNVLIPEENRGSTWIKLSWQQNSNDVNYTYELSYSYTGPCTQREHAGFVDYIPANTTEYNITGLYTYSSYSVSLTAVNATGRSPPYFGEMSTTESSNGPTAALQSLSVTNAFSTNITVQWERISCHQRTSEIVGYNVQYSTTNQHGSITSMNETVPGVKESSRMFTASRLQPLTSYSFEVAAMNRNGQRSPYRRIDISTVEPEDVSFQIHLKEVSSCLKWREDDPSDKLWDIAESIATAVNDHCPHCELSAQNISEGFFLCNSPSIHQVTFRAQLTDRVQATAREVVTAIERWITSSPVVQITVSGVRLHINSTCVVLLSSIHDPDCPGYLNPPPTTPPTTSPTTTPPPTIPPETTSTTMSTTKSIPTELYSDSVSTATSVTIISSRSELTGAIIGGVVAIVFIVSVAVALVVVVVIIVNAWKSTYLLKSDLHDVDQEQATTYLEMSPHSGSFDAGSELSDTQGERPEQDNTVVYEELPSSQTSM